MIPPIGFTQRCPICAQPPINDVTRTEGNITTAHMLCDQDHGWIIKFAVVS